MGRGLIPTKLSLFTALHISKLLFWLCVLCGRSEKINFYSKDSGFSSWKLTVWLQCLPWTTVNWSKSFYYELFVRVLPIKPPRKPYAAWEYWLFFKFAKDVGKGNKIKWMKTPQNSMLCANQTLIKAEMLACKVIAAVLRLGLPSRLPWHSSCYL